MSEVLDWEIGRMAVPFTKILNPGWSSQFEESDVRGSCFV